MITGASLVDLLRRFVLLDDETIERQKEYPGRPSVAVATSDRRFSVAARPELFLVGSAPWVETVVVASREDQEIEGPPSQDVFLVPTDGDPIHLDDPAAAAALGVRLAGGDLDPAAYAEILAWCQWPGGWSKRVVLDPAAWRAGYPAQTPLPVLDALRAVTVDGATRLSFSSSRERTEAVGGDIVLDVAQWSVQAWRDAPATWERRSVAEAVALVPPW